MAANRWQIGLGALILALMLLTAAFSLGVYVGRHGLSSEGLRLSGPASAGPAQGQLGDGLGLPGLEAEPQVVGQVRAVAPAGLQLATQDGPRFVRVDGTTQVRQLDGSPAALSDLQAGDLVAIFGDLEAADRRQLLATLIILLPERTSGGPAQP